MRDYTRHWTPVHLDFLVNNIDAAVEAGTYGRRPPRAPAHTQSKPCRRSESL